MEVSKKQLNLGGILQISLDANLQDGEGCRNQNRGLILF